MQILKFVKKGAKRILRPFIRTKIEYVSNTYSQAGEDTIVLSLFKSVGLEKPTYLDIGVYYPDQCSNTHLFYKYGSRGVCVEADKSLIPLIKELRPEDMILNVGIGIDEIREADFYVFNDKGLSTFDKKEAEFRESLGTVKILEINKVPLRNINSVIREYFNSYPDFLSLDIEGLDLEVLKTLDFKAYPIPAIFVETCTYSESHLKPKNAAIFNFMMSVGYFVYADTYINTLFVNERWFMQMPNEKLKHQIPD
jgi:FkbM family methyltransferase